MMPRGGGLYYIYMHMDVFLMPCGRSILILLENTENVPGIWPCAEDVRAPILGCQRPAAAAALASSN